MNKELKQEILRICAENEVQELNGGDAYKICKGATTIYMGNHPLENKYCLDIINKNCTIYSQTKTGWRAKDLQDIYIAMQMKIQLQQDDANEYKEAQDALKTIRSAFGTKTK